MTPEQDPLWPHIVQRCVNTRNFTAFRRYITGLLATAEPDLSPTAQAEFIFLLWKNFSLSDLYAVSEDCQNVPPHLNPLREHMLVLLSRTHAVPIHAVPIGENYAESL